MKQPIAMRCTKKQFKEIKHKLKKLGYEINYLEKFYIKPYLVNNLGGNDNLISNVSPKRKLEFERKVYEEWNEKIFLEACGIEVEKTFSITESQIKEYAKEREHCLTTQHVLRELFPGAFESEFKLEAGKRYKWIDGETIVLWFLTKIENEIISGYGFLNNDWVDEKVLYSKNYYKEAYNELKEAIEQEVFEALKNEAVKRGFKERTFIKDLFEPNCGSLKQGYNKNECSDEEFIITKFGLFIGNLCIFNKGKWAEIIPTITLSEAEQKLGKKIIV